MYFYNTLTRKKEEFKPLKKGEVSMYHCGPTVYDYAHIGNLRAYILADLLRRTFEYKNFKVTQVMNITDVGHLTSDADEGEDKMTLALKREGKELNLKNMKELADRYVEFFKKDLKQLNIYPDKFFAMPRASEHIPAQIALIKRLEDKGLTYRTSDGIYFDTQAYPDYGKLAGSSNDEHQHPRIGANKEKKNHRDFALWKFNNEIGFESELGKGFPGWHVECSAMSMEALGESFDIHTGGIDHIGTHHTNEMAQSEAATEKPFVRYWLHNEFVSVDGEKMSKSKGNIVTLKDFEEKGIDPLAYRYWLLTAHYRTPVNFTWEALEGAHAALSRLWRAQNKQVREGDAATDGNVIEQYLQQFDTFLEDDLNTPKALALVHEMFKDDVFPLKDRRATFLKMDSVLGIGDPSPHEYLPNDVATLNDEMDEARKNKDYPLSDMLRKKIEDAGYKVENTEYGTLLIKRK